MAKSKYETHVLPNLERIEKWAKEGATAKDKNSQIGGHWAGETGKPKQGK